jgi:hypothetical protein
MVFSNVSRSFVEALPGKERKDAALVYQLKGQDFRREWRTVIPKASGECLVRGWRGAVADGEA